MRSLFPMTLATLCLVAGLSACQSPEAPQSADTVEQQPAHTSAPPPVVGGDRDAHGCIGSAGYRWCAKLKECVRPWELAEAQGFENSLVNFDAFCGVDQTSH